jgi:hypothetical protein
MKHDFKRGKWKWIPWGAHSLFGAEEVANQIINSIRTYKLIEEIYSLTAKYIGEGLVQILHISPTRARRAKIILGGRGCFSCLSTVEYAEVMRSG